MSVMRSGPSSPEDSGEAELHLNIEVSRQWSQSLASLLSRAAADADILEGEAVHGDLLVSEALVLLALAGVRPLPEHRGHGGAAVLAGGQLVPHDLPEDMLAAFNFNKVSEHCQIYLLLTW